MNAEVVLARSAAERDAAARRAAWTLAAGGIVLHPTETVYGLGGDGTPAANRRIARLKDRPEGQPLLLLTPDLVALRRFLPGLQWPAAAQTLADRFWPGPLTIIVPGGPAPHGLSGPGGGVAVRVSPHPTVTAIFRYWHHPMTSTSANRTGQPPARTVETALEALADAGDARGSQPRVLALDAGPTPGAVPSTLITLVERPPRILRAGPVTADEIAEVLPELKRS